MKASVFVGTSLDGFLARVDEFMATADALVIGRKTFDTALGIGSWPYGEKPVVVLSTRSLAPTPAGAVVERMSGAPAEIVARLGARGIPLFGPLGHDIVLRHVGTRQYAGGLVQSEYVVAG